MSEIAAANAPETPVFSYETVKDYFGRKDFIQVNKTVAITPEAKSIYICALNSRNESTCIHFSKAARGLTKNAAGEWVQTKEPVCKEGDLVDRELINKLNIMTVTNETTGETYQLFCLKGESKRTDVAGNLWD